MQARMKESFCVIHPLIFCKSTGCRETVRKQMYILKTERKEVLRVYRLKRYLHPVIQKEALVFFWNPKG